MKLIQRISSLNRQVPVEYPPSSMTSPSQTFNGITYTASASSSISLRESYKAFDKITNSVTNTWIAFQFRYSNSDGSYVGPINTTNVDGASAYNGEWIQLQMSSGIVLKSYELFPRPDSSVAQMMNTWRLLGSNDGTSWTTLDTKSGVSNWNLGVSKTYTIPSNTTSYMYYRIVIISINANNSNGSTVLNEWKLFA